MYIGTDNIYGTRQAFRFDSQSGLTRHLPIMFGNDEFVGVLHITGKGEDNSGYLEWCKVNLREGGGVQIKIEELIGFLESRI